MFIKELFEWQTAMRQDGTIVVHARGKPGAALPFVEAQRQHRRCNLEVPCEGSRAHFKLEAALFDKLQPESRLRVGLIGLYKESGWRFYGGKASRWLNHRGPAMRKLLREAGFNDAYRASMPYHIAGQDFFNDPMRNLPWPTVHLPAFLLLLAVWSQFPRVHGGFIDQRERSTAKVLLHGLLAGLAGGSRIEIYLDGQLAAGAVALKFTGEKPVTMGVTATKEVDLTGLRLCCNNNGHLPIAQDWMGSMF